MSQLRLNPLTGRWVTIATDRTTRPDDFNRDRLKVETGPDRPCPFCPGNEEETPPALETYGDGGEWQIRIVPNRFPAFSGSEPMTVRNLGPVFNQAPASGSHVITADFGIRSSGSATRCVHAATGTTRVAVSTPMSTDP